MSQNEQTVSKSKKGQPERPSVSSQDLAHGQAVIVTARWLLVLGGLLLALWNPGPIDELRIQILVILLLAMANFYLQAQLLMKRPTVDQVVYAASAADLIFITILILNGHGYESSLYIFYFPAILAFSVAFPTVVTWLYVSGTMFVYAVICLFSPDFGSGNAQIALARLIMIAAVAFCGNRYWRIENARRESTNNARQDLLTQIRQTVPTGQA